jgi:NADH-quinone oxidoreductase subunit J
MEKVAFFILAVPLVVAAGGVLVSKNPVYAAMNLVASFFCMAGIYVLLSAHLVAFMQILVYAGAVMVLFLFVIMLLSIGDEPFEKERTRAVQLFGVAGAVGLAVVLGAAITQAGESAGDWARLEGPFGTVKHVGNVLFTEYLLPFEATSLLLLVAIVAAVVVAKERI